MFSHIADDFCFKTSCEHGYVKCFQYLTKGGTERPSLSDSSKVIEPVSRGVSVLTVPGRFLFCFFPP